MNSDRSVIAVDPGYDRVGIAVFSDARTLLHSECFTPPKGEFIERLLGVKERLRELVALYQPRALALETLFFSKNQKTALKVAEARGVILVSAAELGLAVFEYSPQAVKIAVSGHGAADKTAVIGMVEKLVTLERRKRHDDEYDAIAIGITHQASIR